MTATAASAVSGTFGDRAFRRDAVIKRNERSAPPTTRAVGPMSAAGGTARRAIMNAPIHRPPRANVGPISPRPTHAPVFESLTAEDRTSAPGGARFLDPIVKV